MRLRTVPFLLVPVAFACGRALPPYQSVTLDSTTDVHDYVGSWYGPDGNDLLQITGTTTPRLGIRLPPSGKLVAARADGCGVLFTYEPTPGSRSTMVRRLQGEDGLSISPSAARTSCGSDRGEPFLRRLRGIEKLEHDFELASSTVREIHDRAMDALIKVF
jgi:hypothetical protein